MFKMSVDMSVYALNNRNHEFQNLFTTQNYLSYCTDINGLFALFRIPHDPSQWRLFIDSSTSALKVVLLHNGNKLPTIPLAYSKESTENRENLKLILERINYNQHKWRVCSDLKVVGILIGLQKGGNINFPCFRCVWNHSTTMKHLHYTDRVWEKRPEIPKTNEYSIEHEHYLVHPDNIIIPALHIQLGLCTQIIISLHKRPDDEKHAAMNRLYKLFERRKTKGKIDCGIFNGPEIRLMLKDVELENFLPKKFKTAWQRYRALVDGFFGNYKDPNYRQNVTDFIKSCEEIGANMTVKMHFLHNHLNDFPENLGDLSEQRGEKFHQIIKRMEMRYGGKHYDAMLSDHCWLQRRDTPNYDEFWDRTIKTKYFK